MTVTNFLNSEVVDFASYSTMRAIASLVDGLKNGGRKVVYTIQKRPDKDTKVTPTIPKAKLIIFCFVNDSLCIKK